MLRQPPHILVTTPESLYLLLTSAKSREMLRGVHTVIVDEIHALARDKRGSHLALSLERLAHLTGVRADADRPVGHAAPDRAESPSSWSAANGHETASQDQQPTARSSTSGISASWIWPSKFRPASWRPSARTNAGAKFTSA